MMIQYILNIASIKLIIVNFLSLLFYSTFPAAKSTSIKINIKLIVDLYAFLFKLKTKKIF